MVDKLVQVGNARNLRRSKTVSIAYWIVFYSFAFLVGTKYFVFEEGQISSAFSFAASMQHIALIVTIILTFALVNRRSLHLAKKIANCSALVLLIVGVSSAAVRTHLAYQILIGIALGAGAASSLLTFIYELNNTERFFALVVSNIFVSAVAIFPYFFTRDTFAFEMFALVLSAAATALAFSEPKPQEEKEAKRTPIRKKFYVAIVLATVGGLFAVGGALLLVGRASVADKTYLLPFYAACAVTAIVFYLIYRFFNQPVTACLNLGFGCSALSVFVYFLSYMAPELIYLATALAGVTFTTCMMSLYYVACLIIKKYESKWFMKAATISANIVGGFVGVCAAYAATNAPQLLFNVLLPICGAAGVIIVCSSIYWGKSFSDSEWQDDYRIFDTAMSKEEMLSLYGLSAKEQEVLEALLANKTIKQISFELFVTVDTVKTHRASIYRKLNVSTRQELMEKFENVDSLPQFD